MDNSYIIDFSKAKKKMEDTKDTDEKLEIKNIDKRQELLDSIDVEKLKIGTMYECADSTVVSVLDSLGMEGIQLSFLTDSPSLPVEYPFVSRYSFVKDGYMYVAAVIFPGEGEGEGEDEIDEEEITEIYCEDPDAEEDVSLSCYVYINRMRVGSDESVKKDASVEEYDFEKETWEDSGMTPDMLYLPGDEDENDDEEDVEDLTDEQYDMISKTYNAGDTALARFMTAVFDQSRGKNDDNNKIIKEAEKKYKKLIDFSSLAGQLVDWSEAPDGSLILVPYDDNRDGLLVRQDKNYLVLSQVESMAGRHAPYVRDVYRTEDVPAMANAVVPMLTTYSAVDINYIVPLSKDAWMLVEPDNNMLIVQYKSENKNGGKLTSYEEKTKEEFLSVLKNNIEHAEASFKAEDGGEEKKN